ncbi:MAG: T9SS type A sorting domain-containing protein [Sphingobacteriales bacterium]|nr:MAG: T9SS type A sorting domain-containing protein [Sphingobacteriales bacterium]
MTRFVQSIALLLVSLFPYNLNAQANLRLVKELRREYGANGSFVARDSAIYVYAAHNAFDSIKNDWKYNVRTDGTKRIVRGFDVNGRIANEDYQYFDRGFWWPDKRMSFEYLNQKIVKMTYQEWYGGSWQNLVRYEHTYDASGNRANELTLVWEMASWQNSARRISTFTANGITEALQERWIQNAWQPVARETYSYTGGKLSEKLFEVDDNGWDTAQYDLYYYDYNGKDSVTLTVADNANGGFDTTKRMYHFNSAGLQDTMILQQFTDGIEKNISKTIMTYHVAGLISTRSTQSWDELNAQWYYPVGSIEQMYFYEQADVSVSKLTVQDGLIELYPVPVTGSELFVRLPNTSSSTSQVVIYTLDGRAIYNRKVNGEELQINTQSFKPGQYLLQVNNGEQHFYNRFSVIR